MSFFIGNVEIKNKVVLAPMAGISNPSYMKICEEMGVGYAITELMSAEAIVRNNKKTLEMLNGIEKLKIPIAVQIFGSNPQTIAKAAKTLINLYPIKLIDINMGCPVPKVAISSQAGSALLKNPQKIAEIVKAVVQEVDIPVTAKIRLGWDEKTINCVEVAKIVEASGASALAIHARTRSAGYSGKADWKWIKKIKESINIPVIGNGDITNPILAKKMLEETRCDAIMIGRGVLGNPWLIKECLHYLETGKLLPPVTYEEKIKMMKKHFILLKQDKSLPCALLEIRGNILFYLKGMKESKKIKQKICEAKTEQEINEILDEYLNELKEGEKMEMLDIYNEQQEHIGTEKRDIVHRDGLWHKTVHCWLYDKNGNVFFQIRKDRKTLYTTASGHLKAGENISEGFNREIKEEIGIDIDASDAELVDVVKFVMDRVKEDNSIFKDRVFANVYIDLYEGNYQDFKMDPEEIDGLVLVNAKDTLKLFEKESGSIDGKIIRLDNTIEEKKIDISDFLVNEGETRMIKYGDVLKAIIKHFE